MKLSTPQKVTSTLHRLVRCVPELGMQTLRMGMRIFIKYWFINDQFLPQTQNLKIGKQIQEFDSTAWLTSNTLDKLVMRAFLAILFISYANYWTFQSWFVFFRKNEKRASFFGNLILGQYSKFWYSTVSSAYFVSSKNYELFFKTG